MKKTGLASLAENNKRECTISHQESALFTFKTMEDNKKKSFFKRTVALYLKAEKGKKKKNTDMQHRGMELPEKDYKDGSEMK